MHRPGRVFASYPPRVSRPVGWEIGSDSSFRGVHQTGSNHPKVKDVAVIGLADKRLGEITGAIISIKDGMECTEAEIEEFCLDLPRYKRPKKIIFADVPRNATGKIEKPALRKKYGVENLVAQENASVTLWLAKSA